MAYRARRAPARRKATSGRANYARGRSASRTSRRSSTRSSVSRQQTLKIVIEQTPSSQIARPDGPMQVAAAPPKRGKFA